MSLELAIKQLISDQGQAVTFRRNTIGAYDPATSTNGATVVDNETVKVAFVNYRTGLIDGTNIIRGDRKALMSAYTTTGMAVTKFPKAGDLLIGEGDTMNVVSAIAIKPSGSLVGYEIQVRE